MLSCFNRNEKFNFDDEGDGEQDKRANWKKIRTILKIDPSWNPQSIEG